MKLLIVTQKVDKDDSYFGFFHAWLAEFARASERVTVIALERRAYDLPSNVDVLSLGKEHGSSKLVRFARLLRYAFARRNDYDAVFCHMSPWYVIAGAPVWKLFRKPVALWYVHRSADFKLWLAEKFADIIFTASPESFRVKSKKVRYLRQAVDVGQFARPASRPREAGAPLRLISVGRLTPLKNLDTIIGAVALLRGRNVAATLEIIGAPVTESDRAYAAKLRAEVSAHKLEGIVTFAGSVPYKDIAARYFAADASVNACPTGGMDKAVLESLAAETPAFVANRAFSPLLSGYEDAFMFPEKDAEALAARISAYAARPDRAAIAAELAARVRREYGLGALIGNILKAFVAFAKVSSS